MARRSTGTLGLTVTQRLARSDTQLLAAAKHLRYEIDMLWTVSAVLSNPTQREQWLTNALLESFVIHFRSLADVFYPGDRIKPDDVLASDYFDDPDHWTTVRPALSAAFVAGRLRAHKEIAHLTYARLEVQPEDKPWGFGSLTEELRQVVSAFVANVPKERLGWQ